MFKVSNEKQLLRLLKMISSEAVSLSRESLTEQKDPYQRKYTSDFKADEGVYGSLSEQDEEPEEDLEGEEEAEPEAEGDEEAEGEGEGEDLPAEEPAEESPEGETAAAFGASFDSVLTAINSLRAGRSLKDNAIKDATSSYYDSLSEEEREVLLLFLKSLSEILSGGSETVDPSDDPYNYVISKGDEDEDAEEAEVEEEEVEEEEVEGEGEGTGVEGEETEAEGEEEGEEEGEDVTPPIKVNEAQDFTQVRKKLRRLMLRG